MGQHTLDIAIPAHNEEEVIVPTITLIAETLAKIPDCSWRIIVAENGSHDQTFSVVREANIPHVEVFHATERGKGAALREAARASTAEYFGFIDADCSPDPETIAPMLALLAKGEASLAIGSRFAEATIEDRGLSRNASSKMFNILARAIVGVHVDDTQCPLKLMDARGKAVLLECTERTWFLDLEFIARAEQAGLAIRSVPVVWKEFRYPERKSKLNVGSDGMKAIAAMLALRRRLAPAQVKAQS